MKARGDVFYCFCESLFPRRDRYRFLASISSCSVPFSLRVCQNCQPLVFLRFPVTTARAASPAAEQLLYRLP